MKKWWFAAVAIILVGAIAVPVAWAQTEDTQAWPKAYSSPAGTKLTDSQKKSAGGLIFQNSRSQKTNCGQICGI